MFLGVTARDLSRGICPDMRSFRVRKAHSEALIDFDVKPSCRRLALHVFASEFTSTTYRLYGQVSELVHRLKDLHDRLVTGRSWSFLFHLPKFLRSCANSGLVCSLLSSGSFWAACRENPFWR